MHRQTSSDPDDGSRSALRRRALLGACAAAATGVVGAGLGTGQSSGPEIEYAADGMSVRVGGDGVETVTLSTADGSTFEFDGGSSWYGYTKATDEPIEGWHGVIEQTEVSTGEETVSRVNPHYRIDLEVGCSTFRSERDVADLRMDFEGATKHYDPPIADAAEFGSPGRALHEFVKMSNETCVMREECSPSGSRAVTFDCTSVTVEPEEFVHEAPVCHGVELTFADGATQSLGDGHEPPVTFQGEGEHAGKVIETLGFSYDEYGAGWFEYENPEVEDCEPATAADGEDAGGSAGDDSSDASGDNSSDTAGGDSADASGDGSSDAADEDASGDSGGDASDAADEDASGDSGEDASGATSGDSSDDSGGDASGATSEDTSDDSGDGSSNESEFDWRGLYDEW